MATTLLGSLKAGGEVRADGCVCMIDAAGHQQLLGSANRLGPDWQQWLAWQHQCEPTQRAGRGTVILPPISGDAGCRPAACRFQERGSLVAPHLLARLMQPRQKLGTTPAALSHLGIAAVHCISHRHILAATSLPCPQCCLQLNSTRGVSGRMVNCQGVRLICLLWAPPAPASLSGPCSSA